MDDTITSASVVDAMLRATTEDEVREADRLAREWLQDNPGDAAVYYAGESLAMMADALGVDLGG